MKKVLFVATVLKTHIVTFHLPFLKMFKEEGYEVHVCAHNDYTESVDFKSLGIDVFHEIPFNRSPINPKNITAYNKLKWLIDQNHFEIIHCHTPVGGVVTRLSAIVARKRGTKVFYTAHGFHFYKGAPLVNWLIYFPIEYLLSYFTDVLITINQEDYALSKKLKAKKIYYVPGVGVDSIRFKPISNNDKELLRNNYKIDNNKFVLICVGELNRNKNQIQIINSMDEIKKRIPEVLLILVGEGELKRNLELYVKKQNLSDYICFMGYRDDVEKLLGLSDVAISSSMREGLPVNIIEALFTGIPVIVSNCRGNRDLVKEGLNGFIYKDEQLVKYIIKIYEHPIVCENIDIIKEMSITQINDNMKKIYFDNVKL